MIYGMYLSTMGALVQTQRHATISNNLANTNTHGFKPDWSIFTEVPVEDEFHPNRSFLWDKILMKTGGGVWNDQTFSNLAPGPMQHTGNTFDVALHDEPGSDKHSFFMIRPDGAGADETYFSRDGHFVPDQNNVLRTVTGDLVLGVDGQPINVQAPEGSEVYIRDDGSVVSYSDAGGTAVMGQIGVFRTADFRNMRKVGDSRFVSDGAEMENYQVGVKSGYLEESGTSPIEEMTNMIEAARVYDLNMKFLTMQDDSLGQTISRVANANV